MAFSLSRATSIGNTCTRQDLYDLISKSTLTGSIAGGVGGALSMTAASSPPTIPSSGDLWWWDLSKQLMKLPINEASSSACSVWLSVGPDSWEMPVCNVDANTLAAGTVVSFSEDSGDGYYAVKPHCAAVSSISNLYFAKRDMLLGFPSHRGMCGILQATAIQGQIVPAAYKGFCYALVDSVYQNNNEPGNIGVSTAHTGMLSSFISNTECRSARSSALAVGGIINRTATAEWGTSGVLAPVFINFPWGTYAAPEHNYLVPNYA